MAQISDTLVRLPPARCSAALILVASLPATTARAQQVVVIVNGDPITALDIEQRTKLTQLSTHKAPPRQEVLEELIDEKLKIQRGQALRTRSHRQGGRPVVRHDGAAACA